MKLTRSEVLRLAAEAITDPRTVIAATQCEPMQRLLALGRDHDDRVLEARMSWAGWESFAGVRSPASWTQYTGD
jgi:hypothetical protein